MIRHAAHRFGSIGAMTLAMLIAAACNGIALPGQSSAPTSAAGGGSVPGASIGTAADLEAMLPSQLCGKPAKKQSIAAGLPSASPGSSVNPFGDLFGALGGTGAAQIAVVEPVDSTTCKLSAAAFRLTGVNQAFLQMILSTMASQSGGSSGNVTLGGKSVIKVADTESTTYVYVKGDVIFAIDASGDDLATSVLSALP
jgi:hypothetical protein